MDTMDAIVQLINNVGVPVAMVLYFAYRDMKFMSKLDSTLDVIKTYIINEKTGGN